MEMTIPKSYVVFDLKVRKLLVDKEFRGSVIRHAAMHVLRELTTVYGKPDYPGPGSNIKAGLGYDQVLIDLVSEIVMDELGKQHSQTEEANTDGDRK